MRETELTIIEEEAEPLISDSGTGSLASKISTEIPETERQRNGSDDSGVHRLGNAGDGEPLVALLEDNLAGSGNTYGGMPDLGEYDFDSTGFSSVGPRPSVSKTEQTGSDSEDNIANTVNANSAELTNLQETLVGQHEKDVDHDVRIEKFLKNQKESSQNSKRSNEVVVNMESVATEPSLEGSISCQTSISDTAVADYPVSGSKFITHVNCLSEQSGPSHHECLSASINLTNEENDLGDFDNSRELSSAHNNCEDFIKEDEEDKHITFASEPKDSQGKNSPSDIAEHSFHSSTPASLSGSRDLSFEMDGSGISKRGVYTSAINVSMDSDLDFTDSESEVAIESETSDSKSNPVQAIQDRDSEIVNQESNSNEAIQDLNQTHSDYHSHNSSSSQNIQLTQENSKDICDNDDIPLSKQNYDNGSSKSKPQTSNTQTDRKVFGPTSESVCSEQKDKVKSKLDDDKPNTGTNSYTKVKESDSGILYKSSS